MRLKIFKIWWTPLALGIFMLMLSGFLFGLLTEDVVNREPITIVDQRLHDWFMENANLAISNFMFMITKLAGKKTLLILTAVIGAVLLWKRLWYWLFTLILTVPCGILVNILIKCAVHRARPSTDVFHFVLNSYSFPSGHAMRSTLMYGFLAILGYSLIPAKNLRILTVAVMVLLIILISFSRIYMGFHYLTDVLGGITAGLTWLALCLVSVSSLFITPSKRLHIK